MAHEGPYDLVVKSRFDDALTRDIVIDDDLIEMCSNSFVHGNRRGINLYEFMTHQRKGYPVMDDQFALASVDACRVFCNLYEEIEDIVDAIPCARFLPYPEFFNAFNLVRRGFEIKRVEVMHKLVRAE